MAPNQYSVRLVSGQKSLGLVLGDARIDDAGNIVFFVFDFGQQVVVGFFFLVVLDFDVFDGDFFIAFDHRHARFRFGFFFLGGFVLVFAGGGHDQRRLLDGLGFFLFLGLGFIVLVLVVGILVLGIGGADHGGFGGLGLAASALLVERLRLERI